MKNLAILFACLPRSIYISPPALGANSANSLLNIGQSGDTRSICAEDYESLRPYWNPTPAFVRASNRAAWETWFQRTTDTLTVTRLDYFELGQIPEEEGSGAGRSPSDTADFQDSFEVINKVQLDYPEIQSEPGIPGWICAGVKVASASSVGQQVLTSIWRPKTQGICLNTAEQVEDTVIKQNTLASASSDTILERVAPLVPDKAAGAILSQEIGQWCYFT